MGVWPMSRDTQSVSLGDEAAENELPLLRSERIWNFRKFTGVNISLAIATWAFLQGGAVAVYLGAKAAIASIVIGYAISVLLVSLAPCRSEEHTSELQSRGHLVCRLLLERKNT